MLQAKDAMAKTLDESHEPATQSQMQSWISSRQSNESRVDRETKAKFHETLKVFMNWRVKMLQHQINKVSAVVVETSFIAKSSSSPEPSILKRLSHSGKQVEILKPILVVKPLTPSSHRREPSSNDAPQSCQQSWLWMIKSERLSEGAKTKGHGEGKVHWEMKVKAGEPVDSNSKGSWVAKLQRAKLVKWTVMSKSMMPMSSNSKRGWMAKLQRARIDNH